MAPQVLRGAGLSVASIKMNGFLPPPNGFPHPHVPPHVLYPRGPLGEIPPDGFAFTETGELVALPYEPWADEPQLPWESLDNPAYVAYAQGKVSIEERPSTDPRSPARYGRQDSSGRSLPSVEDRDVALVPEDVYITRNGDLIPTQDEGTGSSAVFDAPASFVRTRYRLSREILALAQVESPGANSPLLVVPTGVAEGVGLAPPFGGVVALANFQFGHLGGQIANIIADVLPGSLVRVPTVSSMVRVTGRLAPRYFASVDTGASPNVVRTYLLFPGGPPLTNDSFSDLPPNILALQGVGAGTIIAAGVSENPVRFQGWAGAGLLPTPSIDSLPTRIFRGTVLSSGATAFTNRSRIPIPHGAQSVRVIGGFYNPADTPPAVAIEWTQNLDWSGAVSGPFAPNLPQPIPIETGATSIDVFGGASAAAGTIEIPFAAIFYLNV